MRRCDTIIRTGFFFALFGAILGLGLAASQVQMLIYAAVGVWGGALAGALLGALRCTLSGLRREPRQNLRPLAAARWSVTEGRRTARRAA